MRGNETMTGEVMAILGIGLTAIAITTSLLMKIDSGITKLGGKLDMVNFRLQEQNGKIDRLPR